MAILTFILALIGSVVAQTRAVHENQLIVCLLPSKQADTEQLFSVLSALHSPQGTLTDDLPANILIISLKRFSVPFKKVPFEIFEIDEDAIFGDLEFIFDKFADALGELGATVRWQPDAAELNERGRFGAAAEAHGGCRFEGDHNEALGFAEQVGNEGCGFFRQVFRVHRLIGFNTKIRHAALLSVQVAAICDRLFL